MQTESSTAPKIQGKTQKELEAELTQVKKHSERLYRIWRRHDLLAARQETEPSISACETEG